MLINACISSIRKSLKTPSVAKFSEFDKVVYTPLGGVYAIGGKVDSQNIYGAMLRHDFICTIIYTGDANGGLLFIKNEEVTK